MPSGESVIVRERDGNQFKFRKLSPYCRTEAIRRVRGPGRDKLKADMRDAGAGSEEIMDTLIEFDEQSKKIGAFWTIFDSEEGKAEIFDLAVSTMALPQRGAPTWERDGDALARVEYVASLSDDEQTKLAANLCGITLKSTPSAPPPDAEDTDTYGEPNPPMGLVVDPTVPRVVVATPFAPVPMTTLAPS